MRTIPITVSDEYVRGAGGSVGAAGSHDDVILRLAFGDMWEGTTRSIVWLDANGENPVVTALTTAMLEEGETEVYLVPIPAEPKKVAGQMKMTIKGATVSGEVEVTATLTATARFTVMESDWDNDAEQSADITATQAEQYQAELEAIKATIADARSAATEAKASETAAALSETNAKASESAAAISEKAAADSAAEAASSESAAALSADKAAASETAAKSAQTAAASSAASAKDSETATAESAATASDKAAEATASAASAAVDAKTASDSRAAVEASATAAANSQTAAAGSASAAASSAATAQAAKTAAESAKAAAENAKTAAAASETNAASSATAAANSAKAAATSAANASSSASAANMSATNAAGSATAAQSAQSTAESAKTAAEKAEAVVAESATAAAEKATLAESWAVGGTGTREDEDENNSKYWSEKAQSIADLIDELAKGEGLMLVASYDPDKDGSVNEADIARKLKTAANITIGNKTVGFNGASAVSFSLAEIGAEEDGTAANEVGQHNASATAHNDIRETISNHTGNTTVHITAAERTAWNEKENAGVATSTVAAHDENSDAHPAIQSAISAIEARVSLLELVYNTDVTGNQYIVEFDSLDGVSLDGTWNATAKRAEF